MPDDVDLFTVREFMGSSFPVLVRSHVQHGGDDAGPPQLHRHEFMELVVVLGGHARHITVGRDDALSTGDLLVLPQGRAHTYRKANQLHLAQVLFLQEKVFAFSSLLRNLPGFAELFGPEKNPSAPFGRLLHLPASDLEQALNYLQRIEEETSQRNPGYETVASASLSTLTVFLARRFWHAQPHVTSAYARVESTIAYLQKHYAEPIDLRELAQHAHMSDRNLMRLFRDATGSSPMQYLIRLRVLKAAERLREKHLTVTEAAYASGFFDACYFSKRFSQFMGISPRGYQRQWRSV